MPPRKGAIKSTTNGNDNNEHEKKKRQGGSAEDLPQSTDLDRWRLLDERGRQTWHYLSTDDAVKAWPQSVVDRHHLGLALVIPPYPSPFYFSVSLISNFSLY